MATPEVWRMEPHLSRGLPLRNPGPLTQPTRPNYVAGL